jgi:hypothetical protein
VIIDLIGATTTSTGLKVYARLDPGHYEKGITRSPTKSWPPSTSPAMSSIRIGITRSIPPPSPH